MAQIDFLGDPIFQAVDGNGVPIQGGLLWCYEAQSDTFKDMYPTITDAINRTNTLGHVVTLDSEGRASVVYAGASKFILENSDVDPDTGHGSVIWTADNLGRFGNTVIDPNGNIIVDYNYLPNASNYINFVNRPSGAAPIIYPGGADTNIDIALGAKGNGHLTFFNDLGSYNFPSLDGPSGYVLTTDGGGNWTMQAPPGLSSVIAPGIVMDFAGTTAPTGWLECDGSAISRATYAALFTAIGTTWGVGDGVNTFNLPVSARKARIGRGGTGTAVLGNAVGNTGGTETETLTSAQIPAHTHPASASTVAAHTHLVGNATAAAGAGVDCLGGGAGIATAPSGSHTHTITVSNNTGGGSSHNNIQPSAIYMQCIKT